MGRYTADAFLLVVYFALFSGIALYTEINFLYSTLLYTGLPALYFSWKIGKKSITLLFESVIWAGSMTFIFDYIAHLNNIWFETSAFSYRILGQAPIEGIIWGIIYFYFIFTGYEHFFRKYHSGGFGDKANQGFLIITLLLLVFLFFFFLSPENLIISNFYLWILVFLLSRGVPLFFFVNIDTKKIIFWTLCVSVIYMVLEFYSLELGHRTFDIGNHLYYLGYFGHTIPLEEVLFFPISTGTILLGHEIFFIKK